MMSAQISNQKYVPTLVEVVFDFSAIYKDLYKNEWVVCEYIYELVCFILTLCRVEKKHTEFKIAHHILPLKITNVWKCLTGTPHCLYLFISLI